MMCNKVIACIYMCMYQYNAPGEWCGQGTPVNITCVLCTLELLYTTLSAQHCTLTSRSAGNEASGRLRLHPPIQKQHLLDCLVTFGCLEHGCVGRYKVTRACTCTYTHAEVVIQYTPIHVFTWLTSVQRPRPLWSSSLHSTQNTVGNHAPDYDLYVCSRSGDTLSEWVLLIQCERVFHYACYEWSQSLLIHIA